jgi:hypothetical protein
MTIGTTPGIFSAPRHLFYLLPTHRADITRATKKIAVKKPGQSAEHSFGREPWTPARISFSNSSRRLSRAI